MRVVSLDVTQDGKPAPHALWRHGPMLEVILRGPNGGEVRGPAIVDTGATNTCFNTAAAKRAKMPIVGTGKMGSASHEEVIVPKFAGSIEMVGLATYDLSTGAFGVALGDNVIALIGRDVLSKTLLIYNGVEGRMSLFV